MLTKQKNQSNKNMWIVLIVVIILLAIVLILQTQIYAMLQDLKTSIFGGLIQDSNPFPPARNWLFDSNPFPPALNPALIK
jgi:hypothetical protein